jgi:hypothetical protein
MSLTANAFSGARAECWQWESLNCVRTVVQIMHKNKLVNHMINGHVENEAKALRALRSKWINYVNRILIYNYYGRHCFKKSRRRKFFWALLVCRIWQHCRFLSTKPTALISRYKLGGGGARGSVVSWGTMLQAGRLLVQFPMRPLNFFDLPNPSSRTMALRSTRPLTEMSTRMLLGVKGGRRVRLTSPHLWADCLENVGASTSHNPTGLHGLLLDSVTLQVSL